MDQYQKLSKISERVGYINVGRYISRGNFLFQNISFEGKRVLDVGCGNGSLALWAAVHGASHVVGLEPESDGSRSGTFQIFQKLIYDLELNSTVEASRNTIQQLCGVQPFDIIISYNVINHLDEQAVQQLTVNYESVQKYLFLIEYFRALINEDGILIIADCARDNIWGNLGLRSPFAPMIEWNKHQNPEVWIDLFSKKGFKLIDLRWSPINPVKKLSQNRLFHFLTLSHFVLRMSS
ncbi:MAG: methyltransferase domain-containing protein [Anaerolineae bacterium]|nr:methyltransferase domain-containing protein [Anaerolineae bacterium]